MLLPYSLMGGGVKLSALFLEIVSRIYTVLINFSVVLKIWSFLRIKLKSDWWGLYVPITDRLIANPSFVGHNSFQQCD